MKKNHGGFLTGIHGEISDFFAGFLNILIEESLEEFW